MILFVFVFLDLSDFVSRSANHFVADVGELACSGQAHCNRSKEALLQFPLSPPTWTGAYEGLCLLRLPLV